MKETEHVHIRLVGETYSVQEALNYLSIEPHDKKTRENSDIFDRNSTWNTTIEQMKCWKIDGNDIPDKYVMKTHYRGYSPNHQTEIKPDVWIGKDENNLASHEEFVKHYGELTSTVSCDRTSFIFCETDKHYKLTTYVTNKMRLSGFIYFRTKRDIRSLILNKQTGDIYIRKATFRQRKWKSTIIKNPFHDIINHISLFATCNTKSNGIGVLGTDNGTLLEERFNTCFDVKLNSEHVNKIVNVLGVDLTRYYYAPFFWHDIKALKDDIAHVPTGGETIFMSIILWFLSKKGIKYPNNPFALLDEHYPKLPSIRKHNMNLVEATLNSFGIKGGAMIKLVNLHPEISCFNLYFWYHLLGHDYLTLVDPRVLSYSEIKHSLHDILAKLGIRIEKLTDILNQPTIAQQLNSILTQKEKYNTLKILQSIDNKNRFNVEDFADHIRIKNELAAYDEFVYIKSKTITTFQIEHNNWSDLLHRFQKDKFVNYIYYQQFLETIEQPQIIINENDQKETYYPVILKTDLEYEQESTIQKHCVKTYINYYNSIIISVRKDDKSNLDRVTCEYRYVKESNTFKLIQKRGCANNNPKEYFIPVLNQIDKILNDFPIKHQYQLPTVIETNKKTQKQIVLFQDEQKQN